ncbi:hypothetical protein CAPTEDRAFT_226569 [Capitella teleta]|uniref:G protein-activated inward rectifier potassium channel 3 n=1 Tax=Capitella teleta TaxID=283909 RepID=R7T486_CAPTE|nr:hypothetical protein CAPTEDRAFT_226569 [Capitella teleta]|eukprot:ELT87586.1 hypothetical protein CAPTEDRAFT_226569 [Capitella teleta]
MDSVDIPGIITPVARRGRAFAERHTARLVSKVGESNISNQNITGKKGKFVMDLFTTLLDLRWRWCILVFALAFFLSWLGFAVIYYVILIVHEDHLHIDNPDWKPCHTNVYDFTTAFLFSIETQHTIGYGFRSMEPTCPPAVIVLCAQSCIGVFFQCIVTGLIFAKLSRPKRRAETIMFSERAVIIQRDGSLHLLFRVGDMRKTHIIGTSIRAVLVKNRLTKEGEMIPLCQYPLLLQTESSIPGDSFVFLAWPVTVGHHISDQSPLWDVSAEQLLAERFEIVVILEGTVESTGMVTQVRTSYLPSEILWGHRLAPLLTYKKDTGGYKIDHQQFHATIPVNMAECSARELSEREGWKQKNLTLIESGVVAHVNKKPNSAADKEEHERAGEEHCQRS